MNDATRQTAVIDDLEPVVSATMYLMSSFQERPCPVVAHKIVHNLELLSHHPCCSGPLKRLCVRMRAQWALQYLNLNTNAAPRMQPPDALPSGTESPGPRRAVLH